MTPELVCKKNLLKFPLFCVLLYKLSLRIYDMMAGETSCSYYIITETTQAS